MKTCITCLAIKTITEFHRSPSNADGLRNICKPCACTMSQKHYASKKPNHQPDASLTKVWCHYCSMQKPVSDFSLDPRNKRGYRSWCIECVRRCARAYAKRNSQRIKAYNRTPERREAEKKRRAVNYRNNLHKSIARSKARLALIDGKLVKKPCEVCGEAEVQMHHSDYSKPLQVQFLCRKHHGEVHRKSI